MSAREPTRPAAAIRDEERLSGLDGLYRRYSGWLHGVLRLHLGPLAAEADDLVQETYLRVARYEEADAARHPRALLKRIGVNLARDHMRRHVIQGGKASAQDLDGGLANLERQGVDPEQEFELILKQVVLALPDRYRDVFVLNRFTGMTYEEIARHLGISVKTVEWRMSKALAICAEQMRG